MKQRYLFLTFVLILFASLSNGQTWKKVSASTLPTYSDAFYINANVGWLVGTAGTISKTSDGGKTWTSIKTTITEDLKSVYFINETTGFIASPTKLYKSTNGFSTFTVSDLTGAIVTTSGYWSIYFTDAQKGWFLSSSSAAAKVLQTVDGGTTWTAVVNHTTGNLQTLKIFSATAGIVAGGGAGKCDIYFTKDGAVWTKGTAPAFPAGVYTRTDIRAIYMFDANNAVASGWGSFAAGLQPTIFIKTADGGATWTYLPQAETNKTYEYAYELAFKDSKNGIAAGGATKTSNFMKTTDGGINWVQMNTPCSFQISKLFVFGDNVIAVTNSSAIFKSANFGNSWEILTATPSATMSKVFAVNDNVIYVGGQKGLIQKTTDGGKTWKSIIQVANNVAVNINGLYFVNENLGYSANSYSMIAKTTDGGSTWTAIKKDSTAATSTNNSVVFTSANVGYIVGQAASNMDVIYKTTDGGATFTATKGIAAATLNAVAFFNAQVGAAVGAKMKVIYTKDGGATWTLSTVNGVPTAAASNALNGITFISATEAVAVGDKVTLKSTDGGQTWNYINVTFTETLNGVAYQSNNLWAVGTKSTSPKKISILQSADKGNSWTNKVNYAVFDSTSMVYNDIAVSPNGSVLVCGGASAIYSNSSSVDVTDDRNQLPASFELMQNYPNPFNPSTVISYQLSVFSQVTLKVFDLLGREVATLVNEYMPAGKHSAEFRVNSAEYSSGVYFYQLKAGNYSEIKKMVLIK